MNLRELAYEDWKKGMKPGQIAKKYGLSVNTVKSWATRHWKSKTRASGSREKCVDDIVELHMRIAFADITDFVEFESIPVIEKGKTGTMEKKENGECVPVMRTVNVVKLKDSAHIDGQLINEVADGRGGIRIKLADRQKSLAFLERFFLLNPMDQHKKDYDAQRLELEKKKSETNRKVTDGQLPVVISGGDALED